MPERTRTPWGWWHLAQTYRRIMLVLNARRIRERWRHRHKGKSREVRGEG